MELRLSEFLETIRGRVANPVESPTFLNLTGPAELARSSSGEIAFFFNPAYRDSLRTARPSILITGEAFVGPLASAGLPLWSESLVVVCDDPYLAMARVSEIFAAERDATFWRSESATSVIEPGAHVHPRAHIGAGTVVRAGAVIEAGAQIGEGSYVGPGCWVGEGAELGERAHLIANVQVYPGVRVGTDFRAHAGVVIGSDGFGYAPVVVGGSVAGHQKIWHLGSVRIGHRVEIGANSCVDRATLGDTVIEDDVKLDNLCHVGHNCKVAQGAILCGGVLLAGRVEIGRFAYIGGNTGITNAVMVGDGAKVGALALVTKDVAPGDTVVGNPQRGYSEHFRAHAALNRLIQKTEKPDRKDVSP